MLDGYEWKKIGWEPWSSGYGRRLMFWSILNGYFFTFICCLYCNKVLFWKDPKKQKRGRRLPILLKSNEKNSPQKFQFGRAPRSGSKHFRRFLNSRPRTGESVIGSECQNRSAPHPYNWWWSSQKKEMHKYVIKKGVGIFFVEWGSYLSSQWILFI